MLKKKKLPEIFSQLGITVDDQNLQISEEVRNYNNLN